MAVLLKINKYIQVKLKYIIQINFLWHTDIFIKEGEDSNFCHKELDGGNGQNKGRFHWNVLFKSLIQTHLFKGVPQGQEGFHPNQRIPDVSNSIMGFQPSISLTHSSFFLLCAVSTA